MADMKLPEFDITLIIKAPNQKICDQKIKCETQWTVKQLKQHLSQVYPSQPNESQQRIIYSGRLLHDHLTLKEILKHGADVHTMHLVCPPEKSSGTSDQSCHSRNDSSKVSDTKSQGASIVSSLSEEELRSMYSEYYVYLYQWYQQQMFQYFSNPRVDAPPAESQSSQPPSEAQNPPPRNEARPVPPVQAAAIAAGPGGIAGEFDDENFERDWLDWFYYALRVAILIGLLNYYSSWSKILTAVCIIGIFTMYRFMFQRRNRPAEPQAPQPQQQQQQAPQQEQQQAPANDAERERPAEASEGGENREAGSNGGDVATEPVAAGQVSLFRKIVNSFYLFSQFCVTLITSLVPERVPPLDLD